MFSSYFVLLVGFGFGSLMRRLFTVKSMLTVLGASLGRSQVQQEAMYDHAPTHACSGTCEEAVCVVTSVAINDCFSLKFCSCSSLCCILINLLKMSCLFMS